MKKIIGILLSVMISTILSGCWDQRIYEEIGFILQLGVESSEDSGHMLVTYTAPIIDVKGEEMVEILPTKAGILRQGRENVRRISPRNLEAGKVQQVLFSEEIARKGIHNTFEVLQRDPSNPALAWVVVVEGSPSELIEKASKFEEIGRASCRERV